jgi:hypothetical protein
MWRPQLSSSSRWRAISTSVHNLVDLSVDKIPKKPPRRVEIRPVSRLFQDLPSADGLRGIYWCRVVPSFLIFLIQYVAAFETAQKSMTIIHNRSSGMPRNIQNAVNIVFNGSPQEVEAYVPDLIHSVLDSADACRVAAEQAERSFEGLTGLAQEMVLACTNKVSWYLTLLTKVLSDISDR